MQFRKGLIAAATAAAVMTTGATVVNAQNQTVETTSTTQSSPVTVTERVTVVKETPSKNDEPSSFRDIKPKQILEWISVITAIVGLFGTMATFADKYLMP